jgi:hypothetical protein
MTDRSGERPACKQREREREIIYIYCLFMSTYYLFQGADIGSLQNIENKNT